MQPNIPEYVFARPALVAVLLVAIVAIVYYSRTLSYREYRLAHRGKSRLFQLLDGWATARGRPLIRPKASPDRSAEFVLSTDAGPRATFDRLRGAGFVPHLVATTKLRHNADGSTTLSHAQLIHLHADGKQTEVVLFARDDGGTDVYSHVETAVYDPEGHITDRQQAGDVRGVVRDALGTD